MKDRLKELYEIEKEYYIKLPHRIRECNYVGLRYKDSLLNYIELNIDRLVDFSNCDEFQGVYMIEDFYVGKSNNIKRRVSEHLEESLFDIDKWQPSNWLPIKSGNKEKVKRIREFLLNDKLKITLLSNDVKEETKLIKQYRLKYNLTNRTK